MAYVDRQRKIVVLYPHKTGTHTIRQILDTAGKVSNVKPAERGTNHPTLDQVAEWCPDIANIYEYNVYAFYRDPIEKFLSFMAYNYQTYPQMEPTANVFGYVEKYGYFAPQIRWLTHPVVTVNLLDFRNFELEVAGMLTRLGIPVPPVIPKVNASGNQKKVTDLSTEEITFIKDMYRDDYAFFESKGIHFA